MIIPAFNFIGQNGALFGGMTVGFACAIGWAASIFLSGLTAHIDIAVVLPFLEAGGGWSTIFLLTTLFAFVWLLIALFLLPKRR